MEVPPRARVSFAKPGGTRQVFYAGLIMSLLLAASLVVLGFMLGLSNIYIYTGLFALFVTNIVVWVILCRVEYTHLISVLRFYGFEMHTRKTLAPEILELCRRNELGLNNDTFRRAFVGKVGDRDFIISQHQTIAENQLRSSTRWYARTKFELPFALVRNKSIFVDHVHDLGHTQFDDVKSLSARDISSVRDLLKPMVSWFLVSPEDAIAQKLTQYQLKQEKWLIHSHWVMLEVTNSTNAEGMISMANFLTAFVDELERHLSPPIHVESE